MPLAGAPPSPDGVSGNGKARLSKPRLSAHPETGIIHQELMEIEPIWVLSLTSPPRAPAAFEPERALPPVASNRRC